MQQLIEWLQKNGFNPVANSTYQIIDGWDSWYKGNVRKFHNYSIYNGKKKVRKQRASLQMAKRACEDIADLLMNERVKINIADPTTDAYIKDIFAQNKLQTNLNEMQEAKAALGTVAYVPYADQMLIDGDGTIIGGTVRINYITAENVIPLAWVNREVSEAAFSTPVTVDGKEYLILQIHTRGPRGYVIENRAFNTTNGSFREVNLADIRGYEHVASRIETGSQQRHFVIDRLNLANNFSLSSPMGISLFANAIDELKAIDLIWDSLQNEFELGRKRIFVKPEMLDLDDPTGVSGFDTDSTEFYMLPEDDSEGSTLIKEVDMKLRSEEHESALQMALDMYSRKIGFGRDYYKLQGGSSMKTATEIVSENSDLFRSVKKHELILDDVIRELIAIILDIATGILGISGLKADSEITIDFDDSIVEDKQAEFSRDMLLVSAGAMTVEELRAKYMGESLEDAAAALADREPVEEDDEE